LPFEDTLNDALCREINIFSFKLHFNLNKTYGHSLNIFDCELIEYLMKFKEILV